MAAPDIALLLGVAAVAFVAAFVKGVVGFAYPMVMISGLSFLVELEIAVALLILPLLLVNVVQALQFGLREAWRMSVRQWPIVVSLCLTLMVTARFVTLLSSEVIWLVLGITIASVSGIQLAGWKFRIAPRFHRTCELLAGVGAGFCGGFAGVWAPLIVTYFVSIDLPKRESILAQGVIYSWGAIALTIAHQRTDVLNADTTLFSILLVLPSVAGLLLGLALNSRLNSPAFRFWTQIALIGAGLNLIGRAAWG